MGLVRLSRGGFSKEIGWGWSNCQLEQAGLVNLSMGVGGISQNF